MQALPATLKPGLFPLTQRDAVPHSSAGQGVEWGWRVILTAFAFLFLRRQARSRGQGGVRMLSRVPLTEKRLRTERYLELLW